MANLIVDGPASPRSMRPAAVALAVLALSMPLSGCFGGEARTEWAFEVTQISELYGSGRTGHGVVVAVLDTGINPHHVALTHLFDKDMANGEVTQFRDYVNGRNGVGNAYDDDGHGSHVAGIIAASGSSLGDKLAYGGIDLLGGAPGVTMLVAKVCGPEQCDARAIPAAIRWATEQHAQIISMSFGGGHINGLTGPLTDDMHKAVNEAVAQGVVAVAAAGNEGTDDTDVTEPGDVPDAIAVGAIQEDGSVWASSSRGNDEASPCRTIPIVGTTTGRCDPNKKPEIVAPGVGILSAWTGDKYVRADGTSQATPFVTAAIALMLEGRAPLRNAADVREVKSVLMETAKPVPGQKLPHDEAAGYGLLQARAAVEAYK